ncbi:hypothetical protein BDZ45DRAFT_724754 [Acephala macrosclerotiorum]|nr:hypothetical protein BDZ45DRAFT_724754 [Acephala macrosclerotiorum]
MFRLPRLILVTLFASILATPITPSELVERQNTGCYCGALTGDSCGSRTSSGLSLSGTCSSNIVYTCTEQFGNAEGGRTKKWEEHTVVVPGIGVATCSIFVTSRNEYGTLGAQSRVGASRVRDE